MPSSVIRLPLTRGFVAIVDQEDEWVTRWKWTAVSAPAEPSLPYAVRHDRTTPLVNRQTCVFLHRAIIGALPGQICDHINRDRLDCRRSNLRIVSARQSTLNRRVRAGSASPYRGVYFKTPRGKWAARIAWQGSEGKTVQRHLGYFRDEVAAALAYDKAAREVFGVDFCPNFPLPGELGFAAAPEPANANQPAAAAGAR
jgi:hypothetical protein